MRGLAIWVVAGLAAVLVVLPLGAIIGGGRRRPEVGLVLVLLGGAAAGYLVLPDVFPPDPPPPAADGYTTRYDIRARTTWVAPGVFYPLFVAGLTAVLVLAAVHSRRDGARVQTAALALMAVVVGGGGVVLTGRYLGETWDAVRAADRGDYAVVEGPVTDYAYTQRHGWEETFKVGGTAFRCHEQATLGFAHPAPRGGPIRAGRQVRIAHRGGLILRVETRDPPADPGRGGSGDR